VFEREKTNCGGHGTPACAGQDAVKREKLRSHNDFRLHGSGTGFNKKFNKFGDARQRGLQRNQTFC
jgi:hypothetical protein